MWWSVRRLHRGFNSWFNKNNSVRMDHNTYPKIWPLASWWIMAYAVIFFVLINGLVALAFRHSSGVKERFSSQASYQEIRTAIDAIDHDSHRKIVFLGGSAMWGGLGIARADQAMPLVMRQYLQSDVHVYNLAYPSSRPLDALVILSQLDRVELVVIDINAGFLTALYDEGVKEDYSKYIRVQNSLRAYRNHVFEKSPATQACLAAHGVFPTQDVIGPVVSHLPLVFYKDQINYQLFGKHFSLFTETLIASTLDLAKGNTSGWSQLFAPPQEAVNEVVNHQVILSPPEQLRPTLNSCIAQALGTYVADNNVPAIFYISPHSPMMTSVQRQSPVYAANLRFLEGLFPENIVYDFDASSTQAIPAIDFVDEVHFNAHGHEALAKVLSDKLKVLPKYAGLFR